MHVIQRSYTLHNYPQLIIIIKNLLSVFVMGNGQVKFVDTVALTFV